MRILTISDSFKGTLSSKEVGMILSNHFNKKGYDASYIPISDGGEGFIDVIEYITKIPKLSLEVLDPLFRPTVAHYIFDPKTKIGYIEMAEASGITKLKKEELHTIIASTYGLGLVIKHLIEYHHAIKIVMGIGGSATSDMGVGMLEALGVEFKDSNNNVLSKMNNDKISQISEYNTLKFDELVKNTEFITLSDVINPLLGENGSIAVFGPQKGATSEELQIMEHNLHSLYNKYNLSTNNKMLDFPGAGAAGGVGYAMKHFFNSKVISGIDEILNMINFKEVVESTDIIITGEGKFDSQSFGGKVISGIKKYQPKKLLIICGLSEIESDEIYSIVPKYASIEQSLNNPKESLEKLLENIKIA